MHLLRWICGHTRRDCVQNDDIRERLGVAPVENKSPPPPSAPFHIRFYGWIGWGASSIEPESRSWVQFMRNKSHLPCCSLSTNMARTCGRDSHAGGRMLDYSIRGPSPLPYHLSFVVGLARGSSNSLRWFGHPTKAPRGTGS
jgi:hypothetical protein